MGAKQRSVSMTEEDIHIIREHGRPYGMDFSTSLRVIIREWQEMKRMRVVGVSELPRPVDGQAVPVVMVQQVSE